MTDSAQVTAFYQAQTDHWFRKACRSAQLIGAITGIVDATQSGTDITITPAQAVAEIRRRIANFDAETARPPEVLR